jgi:putative redox protein
VFQINFDFLGWTQMEAFKMISANRKENLTAAIHVRNHEIISGVDAESGGNDEGLSPHELIEAGLAACTIITCQMYANRKQWPLASTHVDVQIVAESSAGAKIRRTVSFAGDLTEDQRARLLEIANKCPVHKLLVGKIEIETLMK